jgi:SAM-dependent MidA family methyltransferase
MFNSMDAAIVSGRLSQIIAEEIRDKGPLTFARFMEICLYYPQYGYYSSGRARRGREGDYYTSPTIHPIFGALLGKQMVQMWRILGAGTFDIVEMGGGEGYLCYDLLNYLQGKEPQCYDLLRYCMVEISPVCIEKQKGLLSTHREKVAWIAVEEVARLKVEGCFLSNELIDSFPVHRVVMEGGELREIYVDLDKRGFQEVQGDPSTPELEQYFQRLGITLPEGRRAEVNLEALRWLQGVAQGLERGFVITIDYGYPAQELFSLLRHEGTLLCYRGHRALSDPYSNLGLQDMTSHVDFTSLILWGGGLGLGLTGVVPQYRFLLAMGILEEAARVGEGKGEWEALNERLTVKNLILPGGMGEAFKVLIQHKGIERPQLEGLRGTFNGGEQWSAKRSSGL